MVKRLLAAGAMAFGIFLMRQAYLAIPSTLMEAARIDGASEIQILWRIMIPLSRPSHEKPLSQQKN